MFCTGCGQHLPAEAKFCPACGVVTHRAGVPARPAEVAPLGDPTPSGPRPPAPRRRALMIVAAAAGLVAAGVVGAALAGTGTPVVTAAPAGDAGPPPGGDATTTQPAPPITSAGADNEAEHTATAVTPSTSATNVAGAATPATSTTVPAGPGTTAPPAAPTTSTTAPSTTTSTRPAPTTTTTVNHAPQQGADWFYVPVGTPQRLDVLANDSDPDGDRLVITDFTQPTEGHVERTADGALLYTAPADHAFAPNKSGPGQYTVMFTAFVSDGKAPPAGSTVMVSITWSA
ncbi:MAG: hypothetical protein LC792_25065 [Actinobacteria bacterium]|nr:hypothetical protein [Actinomycetota bacterium]